MVVVPPDLVVSSILQRDSDLSFPANTVVSASAGSGKTYTLTHRYVQFLLSDRVPHNGLRNILAITFTNLAAKEMRQRVLGYLKALALGREREVDEMRRLVSLEPRAIQSRSAALVDEIIEKYADFQVKTIDSFMVSIFKASALDVGFNPDVEIQLTNDTLVGEAFAKYSRELTGHPGRAALLDELLNLLSQTREGARKYLWDPYTNITEEVKGLYELLSSHPKQPVKADYRDELQQLRGKIVETGTTLARLLDAAETPANRYLQNDLNDLRKGNVDLVVGRGIKDKAVAKLSVTAQRSYDKIKDDVEAVFVEYNGFIARYRTCNALMYYQPYLNAVEEIREVLTGIKRQRGQMFIQDVNKMLVDMIGEERIPEIYFRLGDTIYHYLIDEFQDTSPIQWANLKPLIENSLAQGSGSLFVVGDTKQSIYGFRFADWTILKGMIDRNEFPSASHSVQVLDTNWRSYQRILDFNSDVFQKIIPLTEFAVAAQESGLDQSGQRVRSGHEGKGYVEVALVLKDETEPPERSKVLDVIADCRSRGHRLQDIALLTPKNEDVIRVSSWLNKERVPFISHSSLDIRTRKITGEIIALLQFLDSPIDDLSFVSFILGDLFEALVRSQPRQAARDTMRQMILSAFHEKRSPLYKVFQENHQELWDEYFSDLYAKVGYLPLYDLVSEVYKVFKVFEVSAKDEGTLVKLLEVVKLFEESGNNSIKEFLTFALDEGDGSGWEMDVPTTDDAITLMTVHKAKGLDFPVVIVLLYDTTNRPGEYYVDESGEGIKVLHISRGQNEKVEYLDAVYQRQRLKDDVDELNKLYVALTRAKEEMYVVGVSEEERKEPTRFLPDEGYGPDARPAVPPRQSHTPRTLPLFHHNTRRPYAAAASGRIGLLETKRGEAIHSILSHIEYVEDDLDAQIDTVLRKLGDSIDHHFTSSDLQQVVKSFLSRDEVKELFTAREGRKTFLEKDFANATGLLYRMDRVIVDPGEVTVVDFKTGGDEMEEEYRMQVLNYMALLRDVYPSARVHGVLAYVDKKVLRRVT